MFMSATLFRKAIRKLFDDGSAALARSSYAYLRSEVWSEDHPFERQTAIREKIFEKNRVNIYYNKNVLAAYDPEQKNILVAIEPPAVVEHEGSLDESTDFHAELSFGNFYDLDT